MLLRATRDDRLQSAKGGRDYGGSALPVRGSAAFALPNRYRHGSGQHDFGQDNVDQHDPGQQDAGQPAPVRRPLSPGRPGFSAAARLPKATPVKQGARAWHRSREPREPLQAMRAGPMTSYLGVAAVLSAERRARAEPAPSQSAFLHRARRLQRGSASPAPARAPITAPSPAGPVGRQGQLRIELEPNERVHRAAISSPGRAPLSQHRQAGTTLATGVPGGPADLTLPRTGGAGLARSLTAAMSVSRRHAIISSAGFMSPNSAGPPLQVPVSRVPV